MLIESILDENSNQRSVVSYSYNEYGDCIEHKYEVTMGGRTNVETAYIEYEYDSRGNWTKKTVKTVPEDSMIESKIPTIRNIEYY